MRAGRQSQPAEPTEPRPAAALVERDAADLAGAELHEAVDVHGTLDVEVVDELEILESRLRGVRALGVEVRELTLTDVVVDGCDLSGMLVRGSVLRRVAFRDCRMSGIVFDGSRWSDVSFVGCKLDTASLRLLDAQRTTFDGCVLADADLSSARLPSIALLRCDLRGARFAKADVRGARLHGSDVAGVRDAVSLRGAHVDEDQIAPLGLALFDAVGIVVDRPPPAGPSGRERSS